ncbi:tyrosine-type recombinase/integrase [Streptomyces sp. NPDC059118]|uniref:tyrosine-type recombinase/integrase n=1 Tax=unclassified Streptomyces TaxID=2593676 RepID=UPI0036C14E1E
MRQQIVQVSGLKKRDMPPAACSYCEEGHIGLVFSRPKTASGEDRIIDLDELTVGALLSHKLRQEEERRKWKPAYRDHGLVFAHDDGDALRPDHVSKLFGGLIDAVRFEDDAHLPSGERRRLRRVRLHDLRHGQASLMLTAGVDMAIVSKRLGHSTVTITTDLYSHLLGGVGRDAAEKAASLVPRRRREGVQPGDSRSQVVPSQRLELGSPDGTADPGNAKAGGENVSSPAARSGAGGTRTHGRRIMSPIEDDPENAAG